MQLHAQPYDMDRTGFYFETFEEYESGVEKSGAEEFEIQWIDGPESLRVIFEAAKVNQATLESFFALEDEDEHKLPAIAYLISVQGETDIKEAINRADDVCMFEGSPSDYVESLIDEGCFGDVPEALRHYIDTESLGRDMDCNGEINEFEFNGRTYVVTDPI